MFCSMNRAVSIYGSCRFFDSHEGLKIFNKEFQCKRHIFPQQHYSHSKYYRNVNSNPKVFKKFTKTIDKQFSSSTLSF